MAQEARAERIRAAFMVAKSVVVWVEKRWCADENEAKPGAWVYVDEGEIGLRRYRGKRMEEKKRRKAMLHKMQSMLMRGPAEGLWSKWPAITNSTELPDSSGLEST